ncbi:type I restriction endonuclease subunit R [Helicobacter suis]|uniref:type I restriction endonuclease subunit R n=1 Tax=Helicobacter suis TaxID=104628 RepID=UPI0013D37E79|nr:type I restriction endonuclease subunit R [Helicobacter suis]
MSTENTLVSGFKDEDKQFSTLEQIARGEKSTVVAQRPQSRAKEGAHQSEAELEELLLSQLKELGYAYFKPSKDQDLKANLKRQIEKLNKPVFEKIGRKDKPEFSSSEWERFYLQINPKTASALDKTQIIQRDYKQIFKFDSGETENITLLDKQNIYKNSLQVVSQYTTPDKSNRYDVGILVNGLPLVLIELKKRGVGLKNAFEQIQDYKQNLIKQENLFGFVQIFVISNGTKTKYYSNTTRLDKSADSFVFTHYWADAHNKRLEDLEDFIPAFFNKHTLLSLLVYYSVFTSDSKLLVMRPYQIAALEEILKQIHITHHQKTYGTHEKSKSGGYVWHTTGSGKTLTSFKLAQLAGDLDYIHKVLFVVDRKDLDHQTMKEYEKFQKNSASSNKNAKTLQIQLEDTSLSKKTLITTIQKLYLLVKAKPKSPIFEKEVLLVFDECHRSQLGTMHAKIAQAFKKHHIYGFTGTPIFEQNCESKPAITTEGRFGRKLHSYTIINAIDDKNVLPFLMHYYNVDTSEDLKEENWLHPERIAKVADTILKEWSKLTKNKNFNALLACASIGAAKTYYEVFKRKTSTLKIALIYSYQSEDSEDENNEDANKLEKDDKEFLKQAMQDYNDMFQSNYSLDVFHDYYKSVSEKMKKREIDLLIVVNMFLTGFDAPTCNTLFVDKNLKYHGLLQAFSRTNRIYDVTKKFGNIVCFRPLEDHLNQALKLFGDEDSHKIVLLKTFKDYYEGYEEDEKIYEGYKPLILKLKETYPLKDFSEYTKKESDQKDFITLYNKILKVRNILECFPEFGEDNFLITARELQDYQSHYLDLHTKIKAERGEKGEKIPKEFEDCVFEIELIKQVEINLEYILNLIEQYTKSQGKEQEEALKSVQSGIKSSTQLRDKEELILGFIKHLPQGESDIRASFRDYADTQREQEFLKLIQDYNLEKEAAYSFMAKAFKHGHISFKGTQFPKLLPKEASFFAKDNTRASLKQQIQKALQTFFDKYHDISSPDFSLKSYGVKA